MKTWAGLPILLILALLLRLPGAFWELPDVKVHLGSFHPDEAHLVHNAYGIAASGDLNPHQFSYGSLIYYLDALLFFAGNELGLLAPWFPDRIYLTARLVTVLFGVFSILLVFLLGRRLFGTACAWIGAALATVAPGHVMHSGYATTDVPAIFFMLLALWAAVRSLDDSSQKWILIGGIATGLAAGTKYPAGIVLLPVLAAIPIAGRPWRLVWKPLLLAALVFLTTTPYCLLAFDEFWRHFYGSMRHARTGHFLVFAGVGNGLWYQLTRVLPFMLGWPLLLAGLLGVLLQCLRRTKTDLVVLALFLPSFLYLSTSHNHFLRYSLPLAPILCMTGAEAIERAIARSAPRERLAGGIASVTVFGFTLCLTCVQIAALLRTDPRTAAFEWLDRNSSEQASIGLIEYPHAWHPPLTPFNAGKTSQPEVERRERSGQARFRLVICEGWDLGLLEERRPDYFVLSEFDWRDEERLHGRTDEIRFPDGYEELEALLRKRVDDAHSFRESLERDYELAVRFENMPGWQRRLFGRSFVPHDWLYAFPEIRVYRRLDR
ncbi:MAG: ArnT family glycosyltransferase [Planctomycetota bacterium]